MGKKIGEFHYMTFNEWFDGAYPQASFESDDARYDFRKALRKAWRVSREQLVNEMEDPKVREYVQGF